MCCEAIPRQANFLIDEIVLTGKDANSTISYVYFFFDRHGLGETEVQLHADNCSAQNKNLAFSWYYLWRVMNRHFLLPGHTKFFTRLVFWIVETKNTTDLRFVSI